MVWSATFLRRSTTYERSFGKLSIRRVRIWNFTRIGPKTKKLWLTIDPVRRPSEQPDLGTPQKRCELQLFFAGIRQALRHLKVLHLGRLNRQFQQDWPKDKNYRSFNFWAENLGFRSTELYGAPLEGSTIFLMRISSCRMSMESYRSAQLKYAIFSRTGRKTKKITALKALSLDGL